MGKIIHIDEDLLREIMLDVCIEMHYEDISAREVVGRIIAEIRKIEMEEDNRPGSFYN